MGSGASASVHVEGRNSTLHPQRAPKPRDVGLPACPLLDGQPRQARHNPLPPMLLLGFPCLMAQPETLCSIYSVPAPEWKQQQGSSQSHSFLEARGSFNATHSHREHTRRGRQGTTLPHRYVSERFIFEEVLSVTDDHCIKLFLKDLFPETQYEVRGK